MTLDRDIVFMDHEISYADERSAQYIYADLFQGLQFPREYPALILVHREQPAQSVPMHWHPDAELIYSRNREIEVTIDSKKEIVRPGEFALISSYALHAITPSPSEERQDVMSISFQESYLENVMPGMRNVLIDREASRATEESMERMRHLCEQLRIQMDRPKEDRLRHFLTNQFLFAILQLIYQDFVVGRQTEDSRQRVIRNKMVNIIAYMKQHYQENLTTQSVSSEFGYTREYLCRLFKMYSSQTFKQYLTELRLSGAVNLLRITDKKTQQVAEESGFPDEKSFFAAFKKKYHITPYQYRMSVK